MMRFQLVIGIVFAASVAMGQDTVGDDARAAELATPVRLLAAGEPIDVAGFAAPFVGDVDGDGRKDLLVGQLDFGLARIYLNFGSDTHPAYKSFRVLEAAGETACVPTGCAVGFTPQLVDFDGDGRTDIVTGSFTGGLLYAFRRDTDGAFLPGEVIENRFGDVQLSTRRYNSTVFAHDWDNDGDLDLVLGRSPYSVSLNLGTTQHPQFDVPQRLLCGGKEVPIGWLPPVIADWDGDGKEDLVCGRGKDVVWYRNVSLGKTPQYEQARVLIGETGRGPRDNAGPDVLRRQPSEAFYAICVTDYDHDGLMDLLVGDHYYVDLDLTEEQSEQMKVYSSTRNEFWTRYRAVIKYSGTSSRVARIRAFQEALDDWRSLNSIPFSGPQSAHYRMQRHGGVWLYRRLASDAN